MNELSTIRTLRDLEQQRAKLQRKAAAEERKVRADIESVRADYVPIVRGVNRIRIGWSRLKMIASIALPVIRFFSERRQQRKQ